MKSTFTRRNPLATLKMPVLDLHRLQHDDIDAIALDTVDSLAFDVEPSTAPAQLHADCQRFISILHRGGQHRFTQDLTAGSNGDKTVTIWSRTDEPLKVPPATGHENRYYSVNPTTVRVTDADRAKYQGKSDSYIERYVASKNSTVAALNCLYADVDGKDFTAPTPDDIEKHFQMLRTDPAKAKSNDKALHNEALGRAKMAEFMTNPAHYLALAAAHIAGLTPQPSVIVFSGGGYQCFWLFGDPFILSTDAERKRAIDLQRRWVYFVGGDPGVNDIRRVLRLPGSINHKKAYAPNFPRVTFVKAGFDLSYTIDELETLLPAPDSMANEPTAITHRTHTAPTAHRAYERSAAAARPADSTEPPADNSHTLIGWFNRTVKVRDLLISYGYSDQGDRLSRPGEPDSKGVEIDQTANKSRHWSGSDPMYDTHWRSPFDAWCLFEFDGNVAQAVSRLATFAFERLRLRNKTTSFESYIPVELRSSDDIYRTDGTEKRVFDSVLDVMEKMRSFKVVISKRRGGRAAGVGCNTWLRSIRRMVRFLDCTLNDKGTYEITLTPGCLSFAWLDHLGLAKDNGLFSGDPTTRNCQIIPAINEYSVRKATDPFLQGTSRMMKANIQLMADNDPAIVAMVADSLNEYVTALEAADDPAEVAPPLNGYDLAKEAYTRPALGEACLRMLDAMLRIGQPMTTDELAEATGKKRSSTWRALHKLAQAGLVNVQQAFGQKAIFTIVEDVWTKLDAVAPTLRSYRLSNEREERYLKHVQQWCVRGLAELVTAQVDEAGRTTYTTADEEACQRLERKFVKVAKRRLANLLILNPDLTEQQIADKYQVYAHEGWRFATADHSDATAFERNRRNPAGAMAVHAHRSAERTEQIEAAQAVGRVNRAMAERARAAWLETFKLPLIAEPESVTPILLWPDVAASLEVVTWTL